MTDETDDVEIQDEPKAKSQREQASALSKVTDVVEEKEIDSKKAQQVSSECAAAHKSHISYRVSKTFWEKTRRRMKRSLQGELSAP